MSIITEGMKQRKRIIEYAIKHKNNAATARRYGTTRQYVSYWRKRYDGTIESLRKKSTRPDSHPNQHTKEELELIKHMYRYHKNRGLAHVYRKFKDEGYSRTYDSMVRQIKKYRFDKIKEKKVTKTRIKKVVKEYTYPGELVQIDIKYVPVGYIGFQSSHDRYYQITAIDVYTRRRVLALTNEKSTYSTSNFLMDLEKKMGFKIDAIQTDNGKEFGNDNHITSRKSRFKKVAESLGIKHIRTAPYSPWQNGHVERSHREDEERFYQKRRFTSENELVKALSRYETVYNNTYRKVLNFKSANEMVEEFMKKAS